MGTLLSVPFLQSVVIRGTILGRVYNVMSIFAECEVPEISLMKVRKDSRIKFCVRNGEYQGSKRVREGLHNGKLEKINTGGENESCKVEEMLKRERT